MLQTSVSSKKSLFSCKNVALYCENRLFSSKNDVFSTEILHFPRKRTPLWHNILRKSSFKIKRNFGNFQKIWNSLDFLPRGNSFLSDFRFSDIFYRKLVSSFRAFSKGVSNFFKDFGCLPYIFGHFNRFRRWYYF